MSNNIIFLSTGTSIGLTEPERINIYFYCVYITKKETEIKKEKNKLGKWLAQVYFETKHPDSASNFVEGTTLSFYEIIQMICRILDPNIKRISEGPKIIDNLYIEVHTIFYGENIYLKFLNNDRDKILSKEEMQDFLEYRDDPNYITKVTIPGTNSRDSKFKEMKDNLIKIKSCIDKKSKIWMLGCNLGNNLSTMKLIYEIFWNIPNIYAFDRFFEYYYTFDFIEGRFDGDRYGVFKSHKIEENGIELIKENGKLYLEVKLQNRNNSDNKCKILIKNVKMRLYKYDDNNKEIYICEDGAEFKNHIIIYPKDDKKANAQPNDG